MSTQVYASLRANTHAHTRVYVRAGTHRECGITDTPQRHELCYSLRRRSHNKFLATKTAHQNDVIFTARCMHVVLAQYCYRKSSVRLSVTLVYPAHIR